jgi:hypothetical protein
MMGDNMYNSNWGYHNGKVRNARVRKTFEPVTILKYTATPSDNLEASATVLWRTGKNGYTAMDWYDAADPRPDYYRNLPSYYWMADKDYGRQNQEKYYWAKYAWENNLPEYSHLNWDRLYNVNMNNIDDNGAARSKYVIEERRVDQNDINLNASVKWMAHKYFTLTGGLNYKWNRTEYYKLIDEFLENYYGDGWRFIKEYIDATCELCFFVSSFVKIGFICILASDVFDLNAPPFFDNGISLFLEFSHRWQIGMDCVSCPDFGVDNTVKWPSQLFYRCQTSKTVLSVTQRKHLIHLITPNYP